VNFTVTKEYGSSLAANESGFLKAHLLQASSGLRLMGRRGGFEIAEVLAEPTVEQIRECRALIKQTRKGCLNVVSYHPGATKCYDDLQRLSADRTIVMMAGPEADRCNYSIIAANGKIERLAKISLSSEDQKAGITPGTELRLFLPAPASKAIKWALLNCHEYSHVDLLLPLLEQKIEVIIVVTHNNATRLYWEYAVSDIHRLFCYVVIVNVAELGGSGVFAPFRRIGLERNAEFGAGGQVFGARGPAELAVTINLDIKDLRRLREAFCTDGFKAAYEAEINVTENTAVVPSEHYMRTFDRGAGPPCAKPAADEDIDWNCKSLRVAIGQLNAMSLEAYYSTKYRIRNHRDCPQFQELLDARLSELEARCRLMKRSASVALLDVLVFPEVFVPRPYAEHQLQTFSDRLRTIVICGVDYPEGDEAQNANECAVIRPGKKPVFYRKITRSQYDALTSTGEDRMPMLRGDKLHRFVNSKKRGFGVLICYDFSHLDLINKINRDGRDEPLDVLFVIAHNPFGLLYRSCCRADSHRFYQYVVMCNVSRYGGSGIFAPMRTSGERQTILDIGKGTEAIALAELDIAGLHSARQKQDEDLNSGVFMRRPGIFQRRLIGRRAG
jgi:predicted amidohydrolase